MLTTVDNPYNPYTEYDKWLAWDQDNEYYTNEYLARIADVPIDADDEETEEAIEDAIREILEVDVLGVYTIATNPNI